MSLVDYSALESEINQAEAPKLLRKGEEVKARIVSVRTGVSEKNNCAWFMPTFDVPDQPNVKEFNNFFWVLDSKLDPKQFSRELYHTQQFAKAFGIDLSRPFSPEDDLVGKEGWLVVGVQSNDEYGDQNTVTSYVAGR